MKLIFFALLVLSLNARSQTIKLSGNEINDIIYIREEEKLARDIYDAMYKKWDLAPFNNIRQSEQKHMDEVKYLIERFNLEDPVAITMDKAGEFQSAPIKKYYNELISVGSRSEMDALKAGAKIEEIDIQDLIGKTARTKDPVILATYNYLLTASERHLNAFVRNINMRGETYEPIILDKDYYNKLVNHGN